MLIQPVLNRFRLAAGSSRRVRAVVREVGGMRLVFVPAARTTRPRLLALAGAVVLLTGLLPTASAAPAAAPAGPAVAASSHTPAPTSVTIGRKTSRTREVARATGIPDAPPRTWHTIPTTASGRVAEACPLRAGNTRSSSTTAGIRTLCARLSRTEPTSDSGSNLRTVSSASTTTPTC